MSGVGRLLGIAITAALLPLALPVAAWADIAPTLSVSDVTVTEGDVGTTNAIFKVELSYASQLPVTVQYNTTNGTALSPTDYAQRIGTLTLAPGVTSELVNVAVEGDHVDEPTENFYLELSSASVGFADRIGRATIVDDDSNPQISVSDVSVLETNTGTANAAFVVNLSAPSANTVKVKFQTFNGSATAPFDFNHVNTTLTFAPGSTSQTVNVTVNGDSTDEQREYFYVHLSKAVNATIAVADTTAFVIDNDVDPSLQIGSSSVVEGNSGSKTVELPVTLSAPSQETVTVAYATSWYGSADEDDFVPVSGTLTFSPGQTTKMAPVVINGDLADESDSETFNVLLSGATNASILDNGSVIVIIDDDPAPSVVTPEVLLDNPTVVEGNAGTTDAVFHMKLTVPSSQTVTVDYYTSDYYAVAGDDYEASTGTVTFAPGETTKAFAVPVKGDVLDEADTEMFLVYLGAVTNANGGDWAAGVIIDDDSDPSVSIASASVLEGATGTKVVNVPVTLSAPSNQQVSVDYVVYDGVATTPEDYLSSSGTVTFAPGDTLENISVTVKSDTIDEIDQEWFGVAIGSPVNGYLGTGTAAVTIVDDDLDPQLSLVGPSVLEGDTGTTSANFTLRLSAPTPNIVTVSYSTYDFSAQESLDYTGKSGTLTFAPGETTKMVPVSVKGDVVDEDSRESFYLLLQNESNASVVDPWGQAIINDDDSTPAISIDNPTLTERSVGTPLMKFEVTLSSVSGAPVTVEYSSNDSNAIAPADYTAVAGSLSFAPGQTKKTIEVPITADTIDEDDEAFTIGLFGAVNGTLADWQAVGTIIDDDTDPVISINNPAVAEGDSGSTNMDFILTLSSSSANTVTVDYATADSTATSGSDYLASSGTVTFAPGQTSKTVSVPVIGDTDPEETSAFYLVLSNAVSANIVTTHSWAMIVDDDSEGISVMPSLSINNTAVLERNGGTSNAVFTVKLTPASSQKVTVSYVTREMNAMTPDDFVTKGGSLTFEPGQTSKTVTVPVVGDTIDEADHEMFAVALHNQTNAAINFHEGYATIIDDDTIPTLSISNTTVLEGASGTRDAIFTVKLGPSSPQAVSVDWVTSDGSATAPVDYVADSDTLVFNPGETIKTISVKVKGDALEEGDESFAVLLADPANATISKSYGSALVRDDDTYDIRGVVTGSDGTPLAGVKLTRSGGNESTVSTESDSAGNFTITDTPNGTYSIVPSLAGYTFSPGPTTVTVKAADVSGLTFLGVQGPSITGRVTTNAHTSGVPGVSLVRSGGGQPDVTVVSDASGYYGFSATPNGTYTLSASKTGYSFTPSTMTVAVSGGVNVTKADFIGVEGVSISGRVTTSTGAGDGGVKVKRNGGGQPSVTVSTNANGYYSFGSVPAVSSGTTYSLVPSKSGETFDPVSRTATVTSSSNATNVDFSRLTP